MNSSTTRPRVPEPEVSQSKDHESVKTRSCTLYRRSHGDRHRFCRKIFLGLNLPDFWLDLYSQTCELLEWRSVVCLELLFSDHVGHLDPGESGGG